jgi:hypothetical protein
MKNIITITIFLSTLFLSCDVLDLEPTDKIDADNAIVDENGLAAAVTGAYDQLQSVAFAEDAIIFGDLVADNYIHVGSKKEYAQIDDNNLQASNAYIEDIWNSCYDGINRVNNILAKESSLSTLSETTLDYYIGQCYFLRALNYFTLVKYFGGVPIRLEPTTDASSETLEQARETVENTYLQIIKDLDSAQLKLENSSFESQLASYYGAIALKARVYLYFSEYENHWADAASTAEMVINNTEGITLEDGLTYYTIFDGGSDEVIFDINFSNDDDQNAMADWTRPDGRTEVTAWVDDDKTESVYDYFDPSDERRDVTISSDGTDYYQNKYIDVANGKDDIVILRLAEMYLIRAEALNEIAYIADGEAFDLLNEIRYRAYLPDLTSATITNQQQFRLAIENERRLEFAFEGHRFFDLKRTGRANTVLPLTGNMDENNWLFPIPQSELDINKLMEQNGTY